MLLTLGLAGAIFQMSRRETLKRLTGSLTMIATIALSLIAFKIVTYYLVCLTDMLVGK